MTIHQIAFSPTGGTRRVSELLCSGIEAKSILTELCVKEDDLAKLALDCSRNKTRSLIGYKPLAYEDILVIYQMAYERG